MCSTRPYLAECLILYFFPLVYIVKDLVRECIGHVNLSRER